MIFINKVSRLTSAVLMSENNLVEFYTNKDVGK